MKAEVTQTFDAAIREHCRKVKEQNRAEITRALLEHERKDVCVQRVCDQIRDAENKCNIGGRLELKRFKLLIDAAAVMFCDAALEHMKQRTISQAERQRRIDEANRIQNIEQEFEEEQKDLTDPRIKSYPGAAARRGIEV